LKELVVNYHTFIDRGSYVLNNIFKDIGVFAYDTGNRQRFNDYWEEFTTVISSAFGENYTNITYDHLPSENWFNGKYQTPLYKLIRKLVR
jgi:hypothetical protein